MTVQQILSAIRELPVPERLRVIELVAHEIADEVPAAPNDDERAAVTLCEHRGLLLVDVDATVPIETFDHRIDRDERAARVWGGS